MQVSINRLFLEQTSFDSAAPSGLAAVVHQFTDPGQYVLTFLQDDRVFDRYPLAVLEEPPKTEAIPSQVRVDIGKLRRPAPERPAIERAQRVDEEGTPRFILGAKGYVLFTSSHKEGSYAIICEKEESRGEGKREDKSDRAREEGGRAERFDSRRLGATDIFAVTMIRPGTYSLTNTLTKAKGRITIAYPTIGKEPYHPPAPLSVQCTGQGFTPANIDLQPAQGIVFHFSVPSHIKIDLVQPNDGPGKVVQQEARPGPPSKEARRPVARWRKPTGRVD